MLAVVIAGCEDGALRKREPETRPSATALVPSAGSASRGVRRRPSDEADLVLTDERRRRIEAAFPQARGFLELEVLERALFRRDLKRGEDDDAARAFDQEAKNHWVLFAGKLVNPGADGFDLSVHYTPRDPKDRIGLTSTSFLIKIGNIAGYTSSRYQSGDLVVLLAKYRGGRLAEPAHDVVDLGHWNP
jgi:hypothetical protein